MAYDVETLRAAGLSDEAIQQIMNFNLSDYQAQFQKAKSDQEAALAAAQATGLSDYYVPLYGGADIAPGTTQGILSGLNITNPYMPVYSLLGSENSGAPTDATERMQFAPTPGVDYRLIDKNTGEITTATTPQEIKALTEQANALSKSGGAKANLAIESNQTGNWSPIYTDEPNVLMDTEMKLIAAAMLAATGAGALQPGGFAGAGAGASGAGAGLGTTASLAPGALSSLPANLAAIQAGANTALAGAGLGTAAGLGAGTAAGLGGGLAGAGEAAPIIVTAQGTNFVLPSVAAALGATTTLPSLLGTTPTIQTPPAETTAADNQPAQSATATTMPPATTTGPELVLTAQNPTNLLPAVIGTGVAGGGVVLSDLLSNAAATNAEGATTTASDTASSRVTPTTDQTAALNAGAGGTGILGTGLTASQLYNIGSIGTALLGGLLGGGSGTSSTATTPYVSPFGALGGVLGGGTDYRATPAITDYEKYGFGPEATFFRPEYNRLASMGAASPTTSTAAMPTYTPLI